MLIVSYILLSIIVGCSSTISLKEFWDLYIQVYEKHEKTKSFLDLLFKNEKAVFFLFPSLSALLIILINRLIFYLFKTYKTIISKWLLMTIVGVYIFFFVLSFLFYCCFSKPIIKKGQKNEITESNKNKMEEITIVQQKNNINENEQINTKNNLTEGEKNKENKDKENEKKRRNISEG